MYAVEGVQQFISAGHLPVLLHSQAPIMGIALVWVFFVWRKCLIVAHTQIFPRCLLTDAQKLRSVHSSKREMDMANYRFNRRLAGGGTYTLGTAVRYNEGWRFLSNVASHKSSRKYHPTMEACLPKWVGYPDHCESEAVVPQRKIDLSWMDRLGGP